MRAIVPPDEGSYSYAGMGYADPDAVTQIATTGGSTSTFMYDSNGNMTSGGGWTYGWDYNDRLISAGNGIATSTFAYDAFGNRVLQATASSTTVYPFKGFSVTATSTGAAYATTTEYLWNKDALVATVDQSIYNGSATGTAQTHYIHPDHLGSTNVVTDQSGNVVQTLDYYPMGGPDYGRCKAEVMRDDEGGLFVHSFAHGRAIYRLRHDVRSAKAAIGKAPRDGLIDYAMAMLATADMEADELADFATTVAKAAGIGVPAVMARITKEHRVREQAQRQAAAASRNDGRIIRKRPERDGELTPTVTFLDQVLAADQREEPPMRDASGNFVEVRVREPWALHLLTADGANSAANAADESEAIKAPAEPGLERLTPVRVEMLIERYVRWTVDKRTQRDLAWGLPHWSRVL